MRVRLFSGVVATAAIAFSTTAIFNQPSFAKAKITVSCEKDEEGIPVTTTRSSPSSKQSQPIIYWDLSSNYNPEALCKDVSQKIQSYLDARGKKLYLATGTEGNKSAVCIEETPGNCDQVLFTLNTACKINLVFNQMINPEVKRMINPEVKREIEEKLGCEGVMNTHFNWGFRQFLRLL